MSEKKWPPWLDWMNDYDDKIATLVDRKPGWFGDNLYWKVEGVEMPCITNSNSSYDFKNAKIGAKAILHYNPMNFWVAKPIPTKEM